MPSPASPRRSFLLCLALALCASGPVAAQESKDPSRAERLDVERPEHMARVSAELERLRSERERLLGTERPGRPQVPEERWGDLSPVLAERREVLGLTLDSAVALALENNPDYLLRLVQARSTHEGIAQQQAVFDPSLSVTGTYAEARSPFFSTNPFSGFALGLNVASSDSLSVQTTLSKVFSPGTQLSLTWSERRTKTENAFALNPSYVPNLRLDVVQPLLKGFGSAVNEAGIRVAENSALASDATLAETYLFAVLAVEQAYWSLVQAEETLRFQDRSFTSSVQFLEDQRKREEHGAGTQLDVTIAKAGVASNREAVIVAESALEAARDQVIRLVRPSGDTRDWDLFVVPLDPPLLVPEPEEAPDVIIQAALARRPDYWRALLDVESARQSLIVAENDQLPTLNLITSWQQDGLGGQHHSAWSALGSGRFYTWSVGLQVELPLFLRSERARARQAKLDLEAAEVAVRSLEATIVAEVRSAIRSIRTARAQIQATVASRVLAQERLDATREMLRAGTAVPRDVLEDLAGLAQAESAEVQAYVNYRLALSGLRRVQGTLLDPWLDALDPRVRWALERRGFQ